MVTKLLQPTRVPSTPILHAPQPTGVLRTPRQSPSLPSARCVHSVALVLASCALNYGLQPDRRSRLSGGALLMPCSNSYRWYNSSISRYFGGYNDSLWECPMYEQAMSIHSPALPPSLAHLAEPPLLLVWADPIGRYQSGSPADADRELHRKASRHLDSMTSRDVTVRKLQVQDERGEAEPLSIHHNDTGLILPVRCGV